MTKTFWLTFSSDTVYTLAQMPLFTKQYKLMVPAKGR